MVLCDILGGFLFFLFLKFWAMVKRLLERAIWLALIATFLGCGHEIVWSVFGFISGLGQ